MPLDEPRAHHPILPFLFFLIFCRKKPYRIDDNYRCGRKPIKITIKPSIDQNRKKCQIRQETGDPKIAWTSSFPLTGERERERERGNENEKSSRNRGSTERENEEKAAIWNLTETFVK